MIVESRDPFRQAAAPLTQARTRTLTRTRTRTRTLNLTLTLILTLTLMLTSQARIFFFYPATIAGASVASWVSAATAGQMAGAGASVATEVGQLPAAGLRPGSDSLSPLYPIVPSGLTTSTMWLLQACEHWLAEL